MIENKQNKWNYTILAEATFGDRYEGRPLIGRDTDVRGGVYYGTYEGEAIVVDPNKYPEEYDRYYMIVARNAEVGGQIDGSKVLESVYKVVQNRMQYSKEGVARVLQKLATANGMDHFPDGSKVDLSEFMERNVGVCRHQALACAVLLERFKDEGYINGQISVDRNQKINDRWEPEGGHAWCRYTDITGEVMILDPAQKYFGPLAEINSRKHWDYLRPEEQSRARFSGRLVHHALSTL